MSRTLIITTEAEQDIADAVAWYDRNLVGLGARFILSLEVALNHIRRASEAATEAYPGVRRVVVRRFPYGMFYRSDSNRIVVIAVYHSKRNPRGWLSRV
jgi:toxin ParE1/3/4